MEPLAVTNSFFETVQDFIKENRSTFSVSPRRIISDFQGEEGLMKAYDGRQLLEILQNADDAGAIKAAIELDTTHKKLTFSNTGDPFSAAGIGSLMIRDLSTKRGKKMIGNKGLGFRSILNWAEEITILTNGYEITFSPEIAKREFYLAIPDEAQRVAFLAQTDYQPDTIPFPFLGIPDIKEHSQGQNGWDTVITVSYTPGVEKFIKDQLNEFNKEILIFLNHTEELTISYPGKFLKIVAEKERLEKYSSNRQEITLSKVTLENKSWRVFGVTAIFPTEYQDTKTKNKEYYNLRVAITDDLGDNYNKLFNFFPTLLSIHLPCLIHGTFDLDPSRNHLTPASRNIFLFEKLKLLLTNVALHLTSEKIDWRPYKLLTPIIEASDDAKVIDFYTSLKQEKAKLQIYPCVDGKYRSLEQAVFHGKELSEFVLAHKFQNILTELLLPDELLNEDKFIKEKSLVHNDQSFIKLINQIGGHIKNTRTLAELIKILLSNDFRSQGKLKKQYALLLNTRSEPIPASVIAFTPATRGKEFFRPSYVDLDFIHKGLYQELLEVFDIKTGSQSSRELQIKLRDSFNIQSYEPAPIIISYINTAVQKVKDAKPMLSRKIIKEMVKALYFVYHELSPATMNDNTRVDELIAAGVPLLSRSGKVKMNNQLVFGRDYPEGVLAEELFKNVYTAEDYLCSPAKWEIPNTEKMELQHFFQWLKVGSYSQLEKFNERGYEGWQDPYIGYVFKSQFKPDIYSSVRTSGFRIKGIESILSQVGKGISHEQLLLWIIKDTKVSEDMTYPREKIYYSFSQREHSFKPRYSYIGWQFIKAGIFDDYVIDERQQDGVNPFKVNFDSALFKTNGISIKDIERVLLLIGAKQSFEDLPVSVVFRILNKLSKEDTAKTGKNSMTLYRLALKNFSQPTHREAANKHPKIKLLAKRGQELDYKSPFDIYYADNHTLPAKLINGLWMLNIPKRAGEVQIRDFFGVKTLGNLNPKIRISGVILTIAIQNELNSFMERAKVYILAYRIESLKTTSEKQKAAATLDDAQIFLVSECPYSIGDEPEQQLANEEMIAVGKTFYYQVPNTCNSFVKLEKLTSFRDAFAEIFCILFKITELKNDFRNIIANGLGDARHILETEHESWVLKEAYDLTQLNRIEIQFWKRIFNFLHIHLPEAKGTREAYLEKLQKALKFQLPDNYRQIDFEDMEGEALIHLVSLLEKKLQIPIKISFPSGLVNYHRERLVQIFEKYERVFVYRLHFSLQNDQKGQRNFLSKKNQYQRMADDQVKKISRLKQFITVIDEDKLSRDAIKKTLGINLRRNEEEEKVIMILYPKLKSDYEEEWHGLTNDLQSLSYFPGHDAKLLNALKKIRGQDEVVTNASMEDLTQQQPAVVASISFVQLRKTETALLPSVTRSTNSPAIFDPRMNQYYRHAGKEAEKLVRDALVQAYGRKNVKWVSGFSDEDGRDDTCGYDIKYRIEGKWKLLEVKSASNDSFIISYNEVQTGLRCKEKYHLALVKNGHIHIVENFFMNDSWANDFMIVGNYTAVPKEWLVSYFIS